MTSRFNHKYVAFIDGLYINDLCDTDNEEEFLEVVEEYGQESGFIAYVDDKRVR